MNVVEQLNVPMFGNALSNALPKLKKTKLQKVVGKTCKNTTNLANLLPTGPVLAFQILAPLLTRQGHCPSATSQSIAFFLIGFIGLCSFLLSFTDSCRDSRGKVRYGVATWNGLWVIDSSYKISEEESKKYKLNFVDFIHGFMSFLVFEALALFDQNVSRCFYPDPSDDMKIYLTAIPVSIGIICSILFLLVPSKRHGIGFPLSRE